jgi:hypothetical protein
MTATHAKDMSFTIPDFLKEYAEDGDSDDYIFEYTNKSRYDTDMAKEYQITPEAYGVYFVYETPEGVKKHYKIDDFYEDDWDIIGDYNEDISFKRPTALELAMKRIEELEKKLAETEAYI